MVPIIAEIIERALDIFDGEELFEDDDTCAPNDPDYSAVKAVRELVVDEESVLEVISFMVRTSDEYEPPISGEQTWVSLARTCAQPYIGDAVRLRRPNWEEVVRRRA